MRQVDPNHHGSGSVFFVLSVARSVFGDDRRGRFRGSCCPRARPCCPC